MGLLIEIATTLGGAAAGSGTTGLLAGLFGRRRERADNADKLSAVAVRLVEPLHNELQTVRSEFAAHKAATEAREARRNAAAALHIQWDVQVAESLRVLGQDVPPPPPLDAA